ncbi:hypothetical protein [Rhodococcus sp. NPDC057529]|uniref:hypothetical protein n=1 Tax=Rhodococcus sp. NPDC057529 TaxID=3346158 RepID=UPI00366FABE4
MTSHLKRLFYAVPAKVYGWSSAALITSMFVLWSIALLRSPTTAKDWASPLVAVTAVVVATFAMLQSRRSADAAHQNLTISELQEKRRRHGWALESHPNADRYVLRNVGTVTSTDVKLDGNFFHLRFVTQTEGPVTIAPGEARSFDAIPSFSQHGVEIAVTWVPENESERRTWVEVLQPSQAGAAARREREQRSATAQAWDRQRAVADRDEYLRLLLQLGDAYSAYKQDPTAAGMKLRVQLLVAALPPSLAREIGYEVDVARDVWGDSEYPLEQCLAEEDRHLVDDLLPEIELMWNVRTVSGYSVYGPIGAEGPDTEPRVWWAIQGYVDRVKERESGNRQLRLSPQDRTHREQAKRWIKDAQADLSAQRATSGIPDSAEIDGADGQSA